MGMGMRFGLELGLVFERLVLEGYFGQFLLEFCLFFRQGLDNLPVFLFIFCQDLLIFRFRLSQ